MLCICTNCLHCAIIMQLAFWSSEQCLLWNVVQRQYSDVVENKLTEMYRRYLQGYLQIPDTSVTSVALPKPYRNFCEFCKKSNTLQKSFVSSVRNPIPYPHFTNPTEHKLGKYQVDPWANYFECYETDDVEVLIQHFCTALVPLARIAEHRDEQRTTLVGSQYVLPLEMWSRRSSGIWHCVEGVRDSRGGIIT